jgi:hypothetical protein
VFTIHLMKLKETATSLLTASTNLLLSGLGLSLGFTSYSEWAVLLLMVVVPVLLVVTVVFFLRDVWRKATRKQAVVALLLSFPTLALEGWFFNWGRGW